MTVLVTGGAGYVGCVLVPKLLAAGHDVVVYDLMLFGAEGLAAHPRLRTVVDDIRDVAKFSAAVEGCDSVIHLACISNDPSFELDPAVGKSINFDCFEPLVAASKRAGVARFVYASTSSVYGLSEAPEVTEDHPLAPLTDYSKYKALCEPILLREQSPEFLPLILRPATVCGDSPRMRFDLTVNILTNHAVRHRRITVFGGSQKRPNIHIEDLAELYVDVLSRPAAQVAGEVFNAGYENHTVADLARMARKVVEQQMPELAPITIATSPTDDLRSYHVSSRKIAERLGWRPRRTIEDAIRDLCRAFQAGRFPDSLSNDQYFNVRTVKSLTAKLAMEPTASS